jgi:hypothetical protein
VIRSVIVLLVLFAPATAVAQATRADLLTTSPDAANAVELRAAADDAFVAEVAYARAIHASIPLVVDAQLDVPWAELDARDWRLRIGVTAPIAISGRWHVIPRLAPTLRASANDMASLLGVGVDVATLAGYFAPRWFIAAEVGFDADLASRVAPTSDYRMYVNDEAPTGWYSTLGGELRYGATFGTTFGANDLGLRAGMLLQSDGTPPTLPFYAVLSYARRW